jgi:hypothetical protein
MDKPVDLFYLSEIGGVEEEAIAGLEGIGGLAQAGFLSAGDGYAGPVL